MIENYHTHTYLCNHAQGKMEDYVVTGIKNGLKKLGFSDHVPMEFSVPYASDYRMSLEETKLYVDEVLRLKEKYKNDIEIFLGFEAEYYPLEFEKMMAHIKKYPVDYMILGQHFINNEYDGVYVWDKKMREKELSIYVNQVIEAIEKGGFTYIAHPDLPMVDDDTDFYRKEMEKLCISAKEKDVPLEYNLLGLMDERGYPHDNFWKIAKEVGNKVIMGCDAHTPFDVGNNEAYLLGHKKLSMLSITPEESVKLINPLK